jgi:hypothetical protein
VDLGEAGVEEAGKADEAATERVAGAPADVLASRPEGMERHTAVWS